MPSRYHVIMLLSPQACLSPAVTGSDTTSFLSSQVLFGQYAKTGPLGIWRSFPLARGVGIVWIIFIYITISLNVTQDSNILVYTYTVS